MELHRIIKRDSRSILKSCWGRSAAAGIIVFAVYLLLAVFESLFMIVFSDDENAVFSLFDVGNVSVPILVITSFSAVVAAIVFPALAVGFKKMHINFAADENTEIASLFDVFSSFKFVIRSIVFFAMLIFRYLFFGLLAVLPGGVLIFAARMYIVPETKNTSVLQICAYCVGVIVTLLCLSLLVIYAQRWFGAVYYLSEGKNPSEAFKLSVRATKGLNTQIIKFKLSFFGWALLSILFFPMLWALPYYSVSEALYAKYIMERYERSLADFPENNEE